jgi:hypothetical protein
MSSQNTSNTSPSSSGSGSSGNSGNGSGGYNITSSGTNDQVCSGLFRIFMLSY